MSGTYIRAALIMFSIIMSGPAASAQNIGYITGAGFADIRLFGGTSGQTPVLFGDTTSRDATGIGGSVRVGTWVHPRWTIEVGADVSSKTTATITGPVIAIFPPVPPLEFRSSTSFVSVTALAGFHSPAGPRVRLGYLAGFSFMRTSYTTDFPNVPRLAAFTEPLLTFTNAIGGITSIPRSTLLTLPQSAVKSAHNSGALTLGVEAAIALTPKIAVVPELRASTFSTSPGSGGMFLIRPGVGVRWNF